MAFAPSPPWRLIPISRLPRIADGTRRIADWKAYIEKQEQAGRPTDEARELLALFGASVISSPFIGVELTSWKARTLPQVTAVFVKSFGCRAWVRR